MLDILRERGQTDIATLVQQLGASEATIRRDLTNLEKQRVLSRTFGGARLLETESLVARTFERKREGCCENHIPGKSPY